MRALVLFISFFFLNTSLFGWKNYELKNEPIDVVIPCAGKDVFMLEKCIEGIQTQGENIRRVIVVSAEKFTDKAEWFDEALYPFTKKEICQEIFDGNKKMASYYLAKPGNRVGWIYQQFLKFYAPFVIPNISSNVLVLDSDTVFLNPVSFIDEKGGGFLDVGDECSLPYFSHAERLIPGFRKVNNFSGICHHMLFQRAILEDLFYLVELQHGVSFWKAACRCIDLYEIFRSCLSEYEIYFNFALANTEQVKVRPLQHEDIHKMRAIERFREKKYHHVSYHSRG